jgi:hypothetical protein
LLILPLIPLLISFLVGFNTQQSGIPQGYPKYFMMEIGPATAGERFEFELVRLSRSGKEVILQRLDGKAPFKLSLHDETFMILHAKSGRGKIVKQYRMTEGEQRSYQYCEKGEAIIVEFLPKRTGWGRTRSWSQGERVAPRLTVTVMEEIKE